MKKSFFSAGVKAMFFGLATVAMVGMTSCGGDEPDPTPNPQPGEVVNLTIDPTEVEVLVGEEVEVQITAGNGGYEVISADATIAEATVADKVITIKGLKAGATVVTVKDAQKKATPLKVTVTASGKNNIDTKCFYTINATANEWSHQQWQNDEAGAWAKYKGPKEYTGTVICTKRDYDNKANNWLKYDNNDIKELFAAVVEEEDCDNIFVCAGLGYEGALDYGHAAIVLRVTEQDDAARPGMKVVKVLGTSAAGYLGWENGAYTSTPGEAYYNPADGSFTLINCQGRLAWEGGQKPFDFCADRTYTPEK